MPAAAAKPPAVIPVRSVYAMALPALPDTAPLSEAVDSGHGEAVSAPLIVVESASSSSSSSIPSTAVVGTGVTAAAAADTVARPLRGVILDCGRVSAIDGTACRELKSAVAAYRKAKVSLLFACLPGPVRDRMEAYGVDMLADGKGRCGYTLNFLSVDSAVAYIEDGSSVVAGASGALATAPAPQETQAGAGGIGGTLGTDETPEPSNSGGGGPASA
jgi:hypothetical protein